jgi:uncharacterized membrane protein
MTLLQRFSSSFDTHTRYWLLSILLVAAALRLYNLDAHGLFFDEKATMLVSQGVVQDGGNQHDVFEKGKLIFTNQEFWREKKLADYYEAMTRSDIGNSPFYYLLLHQWMSVFGISDFSARSMSVLFSVLTVLMLFVFAQHFSKSSKIALTAAVLTTIEPFFIAYSQQARNYSLTFFLTLTATYCFLRALEADTQKHPSTKWYVLYGLTAFLGLYSHFLVASVLLAHGVYVLLFVRKWQSWVGAGLAVGFAVAGLAWWFMYGGGQYTLFSLNHQSKVYLECALNRPYNNPYGIILPATFENVLHKSLPILGDMWIFTNGITTPSPLNAFWFIKQMRIMEVIGCVGFFLFCLSFKPVIDKTNVHSKNLWWFLLLMSIVPTAFLILNAYRAGHTYGLTQRYSGFSFPFTIILASMALGQLWAMKHWSKYLIAGVLLIQVGLVANTLRKVYADRSPKYNYRDIPRVVNPHYKAVQKALVAYQPGDTLLMPAPLAHFDNNMDRTYLRYSVADAQYFNLYLPKEGIFVQKLDTVNVHQIRLKKATGQIVELMNLEGKRY